MSNETEQLQQTADTLTLGPHERCIEATDEQGRTGRWIVHRPTVREECLVGVRFAQLRTPATTTANPTPEPVQIDDDRYNLAYILAVLSVVITKRPEWFPEDPGECLDTDLIYELFALFETWRTSFRRQVSTNSDADSGTP